MKFKLTKTEKSWILYDVGNSAFVLLVSTIFPIFFNSLAANGGLSSADYLAYWGYAASIATLIVAAIGPILGKMSDRKQRRKALFFISIVIGAAGCAALGFVSGWLVFLIIFVIAKSGHSLSLIFYDSMLSDITTNERMDNVSHKGMPGAISAAVYPLLSRWDLFSEQNISAFPKQWL